MVNNRQAKEGGGRDWGPNPSPTSIGAPKSLHFAKFTILSLLFLSPRRWGPNSIISFDGGHDRIAPPGFATARTQLHAISICNRLKVISVCIQLYSIP